MSNLNFKNLSMVLSIKEILDRGIIQNREFGNGEGLVEPEGAAVDVRVGEIWEMDTNSEAFLKKLTRKTRDYKKVAEFTPGKDESFILQPNKYYQFKTIESTVVPQDVVGRFIARYNLLACGIMILGYKVDPGYEGTFGVPVVNLSGVPFEIELGSRFAQFEFHRIDGDGVMYRGQWKGDRLFTEDGEEVQV
jgi:deoxycytidine triphosphate deaminase